jgi:hypothetical protein
MRVELAKLAREQRAKAKVSKGTAASAKQKDHAKHPATAGAAPESPPQSGVPRAGNNMDDAEEDTSLASLLSCFVLRRTKDGVNIDLPSKTRKLEWVPMGRTQAAIAHTIHAAVLAYSVSSSFSAKNGVESTACIISENELGLTEASTWQFSSKLAESIREAIEFDAKAPGSGIAERTFDTFQSATSPSVSSPAVSGTADIPINAGKSTKEAQSPQLSSLAQQTTKLPDRLGINAATSPVFIGNLSRVVRFTQQQVSHLSVDKEKMVESQWSDVHFNADGIATMPIPPSSIVRANLGPLVMILRKAANHPLLLRTRYKDAHVLDIARCMYEMDIEDASTIPSSLLLTKGAAPALHVAHLPGFRGETVDTALLSAAGPLLAMQTKDDIALSSPSVVEVLQSVAEGSGFEGQIVGCGIQASAQFIRSCTASLAALSRPALMEWAHGNRKLADLAQSLLESSVSIFFVIYLLVCLFISILRCFAL